MQLSRCLIILLAAFTTSVFAADPVCKKIGETPDDTTDCCDSLSLNSTTNKCEDFSYSNPSLISCSFTASCASSLGCYPQRGEDVAKGSDISGEDQALIETSMLSAANRGEACYGHLDCKSLNCQAGFCADKFICRMAAEGEVAMPSVSCEGNLVKDPSGKCTKSAENSHQVFVSVLNANNILRSFDQQKCTFEVNPEARELALMGMKTLRAMEWMFSTIGLSDGEDCLKVLPFYRTQIADVLKDRKIVLLEFSRKLAEIEKDYDTISKVTDKSEGQVVFDGVQISAAELSARKASGVDALRLMWRKNILFQEYEAVMLDLIQRLGDNITKFNDGMKEWKDGDTQWRVGDEIVPTYNCRAFYKKWSLRRGWKTIQYDAIGKRWDHLYVVNGRADKNSSVFSQENILNYLSFVTGKTPDEIKTQLLNGHSLVDPIMPGKTVYSSYGLDIQNGGPSNLGNYVRAAVSIATLGLFGGMTRIKDNYRPVRALTGNSDAQSYINLKKDFGLSIKEFYKNMKSTDPAMANIPFVYEPEITTPPAKDCFDQANNPDCEAFNKYLEELTDIGFAQFLAYSAHSTGNYSNYFPVATTMRRKLFDRLQADLSNLSVYYHKVIELREMQNNCIMKVHNQVVDEFIDTSTAGINKDTKNYYESNGSGGDYTAPKLKLSTKSKLTPSSKNKYLFDLGSTSLKSIKNLLSKNSSSSSNSGHSGSGSIGQGDSASANAARIQLMNQANQKASSSGVNIAAKDLNSSKAASSLGNSFGSSSGGSSSGASGSSNGASSAGAGFNFNKNGSSLSESSANSKSKSGSSAKGEAEAINANKAASSVQGGAGNGTHSGMNGGYLSEGDGSEGLNGHGTSGSHSSGKDATGLSDEEKEIMMANYERNKSDYKSEEDDGLFKVVSKAYVRNLDKVLKKKKKEIAE
ncbi:MAG: hypothetical protein AB7I27_11315, partial [Bacteriovoracaceae bacterium]